MEMDCRVNHAKLFVKRGEKEDILVFVFLQLQHLRFTNDYDHRPDFLNG